MCGRKRGGDGGLAVAGLSARKVPGPPRISLEPGDSNTKFMIQNVDSQPALLRFF